AKHRTMQRWRRLATLTRRHRIPGFSCSSPASAMSSVKTSSTTARNTLIFHSNRPLIRSLTTSNGKATAPSANRLDAKSFDESCLTPMKIHFFRCLTSTIAILVFASYQPCRASDHADPQSVLNPFYLQPEPAANITDLHAFIVDRLVGEDNQVIEGEHLIVSICVRRALIPEQESKLKLEGYKFRVHFDLTPKVVRSAGDKDGAIAQMLEGTNSRDSLHDMDRSRQALYGGIITQPDKIN